MTPKIPCLDLKRQHLQIKDRVFKLFEEVYASTAFSGGPFVERFEDAFARFCQTNHAIGVNNGTSALHLAMECLGIGRGDEVIVPANTFIATAWGVSYTGATPVFVDCDPESWEIDPSKIEEKITEKTRAIVGVHLYGHPFPVDEVKKICEKHGLFMLEDAAQAHGALYHGKPVGGFGEMACFSFYPGKNLGACGEAGGITTNHEKYKHHLHSLRNHGSSTRYYHDELGYNMRMGGLEAASLLIKLEYLAGWNAKRQEIARQYHEKVSNPRIRLQKQQPNCQSVYHLMVCTTENRDHLINYLNEAGIAPGLHYPVPCHLQRAYAHLGYKEGDCPNAEHLASHCLSLPMFAELTQDELDYVIDKLNQYH